MIRPDEERPSHRQYIVFGLGFGDEGKGTTTDTLVRHAGAHTVVRYNGGPQAGHNVISPQGIWHCFAQFGSGTLTGANTYLTFYMPAELETLLAEANVLATKGVPEPLKQLTIDARCLVITPGHKLVGQLREIQRGEHRFGSCGMGVGETIQDAERGLDITVQDLLDPVFGPRKLHDVLLTKQHEAENLLKTDASADAHERMRYFRPRLQSEALYTEYSRILQLLDGHLDFDGTCLQQTISRGPCVWEGAQGALLDRDNGFAPYVTKSRATWHNAQDLLTSSSSTVKIGVLRTFAHRHGCGPFVTENNRLLNALHDPRNPENRWQGSFRVGELDLVALRYGLHLNGGADWLSLSHFDQLSSFDEIRVCTSYLYNGCEDDLGDRFQWERRPNGQFVITGILSARSDPPRPSVADILFHCNPCHWQNFFVWSSRITSGHRLPGRARTFLRWLESADGLNTPVGIISFGPRTDQKQFLF
ncbi:MAG TPA: adenylosuccinate synthetase [Patescibacteria group bacterium]|nr:adenylosuccinate synthetase [Patescibacteria group bacterium]